MGPLFRNLLSLVHPRTRRNISTPACSGRSRSPVSVGDTASKALLSKSPPFPFALLRPLNSIPDHYSKIVIAGDSAGGNLASALLLHLAYPHPSALVPRINLSSQLQGVLLISPWISFATSSPSFEQNAQSDYITSKAIKRASEAYLGIDYQHDDYTQPINAPSECWTKVADHVVNEVMIWAGGGEVLIDEISNFARVMKKSMAEAEAGSADSGVEESRPLQGSEKCSRSRLKFVVTEKAAHEQMIFDHFFLRKKGNGNAEIEHWLRTVLSS